MSSLALLLRYSIINSTFPCLLLRQFSTSIENGVDERADENPHFADYPRTTRARLFNCRSWRDCRQRKRYRHFARTPALLKVPWFPFVLICMIATSTTSIPLYWIFGCLVAIRHGLSLSLSSALESYCPLYSLGNMANKDLCVAKATHISLREGTGGKKLDLIYRPCSFLRNTGQMKTYWLMGKKGRCAVDRSGRVSAVPEELQAEGRAGSSINRRYSPVIIDDITMARKGAVSSTSNRNTSPVSLVTSG